MKDESRISTASLLWYFGLAIVMLWFTNFVVSGQINQQFAQAQQENAAALRKYEWKSRIEIQRDGETKNVQVALMRYDSDGSLQKTTVSTTSEQDLRKHGLRGLIAQKKKNAFMERVEDLGALAKSYGSLPPDKMQRLMATASINPDQKETRVALHGVLQSGDSMTLWLDPVSRKQRRVEVETFMEKKPVRIVLEFQDLLQSGPTYVARSQVYYDGDSVAIITENFDYKRAQS
ncbi:MAG TPA: hypothetical protein VN643_17325 [Pyrinomonadaceae bacterium]|nr:hypothetical protein [Pyrinomonadaceae bacterium]